MEIPVIETARLRLRRHRPSDLSDCAAMWGDERVTRFISGRASSEQQTWSRLLAYLGHWAVMGFGYWAIEEKSSKAFVGEAGLADFKRDVGAWPQGTPELGFVVAPRFHGGGYATECVAAILGWADSNLPCEQTVCIIDPRNEASLRTAARAGYTILEEGVYSGQPTLFLARARHSAREGRMQ
jgi:RimJ/RimL family protein N-acetyltransferase